MWIPQEHGFGLHKLVAGPDSDNTHARDSLAEAQVVHRNPNHAVFVAGSTVLLHKAARNWCVNIILTVTFPRTLIMKYVEWLTTLKGVGANRVILGGLRVGIDPSMDPENPGG